MCVCVCVCSSELGRPINYYSVAVLETDQPQSLPNEAKTIIGALQTATLIGLDVAMNGHPTLG